MLDWQEKKWIKVVAIIVIASFLSYDIAWATEFSPVFPSLNTTTKSTLSKIIKSEELEKLEESEEDEEIELSFRSQLIPTKKYSERSGFLRMESVKDTVERQRAEMERRKNIEEDRMNKNVTDFNINKGLYMNAVDKAQAEQAIEQAALECERWVSGKS